jgi:hypothetical protein
MLKVSKEQVLGPSLHRNGGHYCFR